MVNGAFGRVTVYGPCTNAQWPKVPNYFPVNRRLSASAQHSSHTETFPVTFAASVS